MPRILTLPTRPESTFGVFNRRGNLASANDDGYACQRAFPGWQIQPTYGYPNKRIASDRAEADQILASSIERWAIRVRATKAAALTLSDVLVDRFITQITQGSFGFRFYFGDGTSVAIERTRGYNRPSMTGPTEGPILIRRILADQRTFRLTDGDSLLFSTKMMLDPASIPDWIINQIFPD